MSLAIPHQRHESRGICTTSVARIERLIKVGQHGIANTLYVLPGMGNLRFEWDPKKEAANRRKHGILFLEAQIDFYDEHVLLIDDPERSGSEDRFILLGLSGSFRVLVVVHCYRLDGGVIRIISARGAAKPEKSEYNARWNR